MPRSRRVRPMFTVMALGALVVVAVLAVTPAGPRILRSAAAAPPIASVSSQYTCDLSPYGYTGPPVTIAAIADVQETAAAIAATGFGAVFSTAGPVSFSTSAATLPATVAARLANLSSITLAATVPVFGAPAASPDATIRGTTQDGFLPTGPLTELQVVNASVTAFFSTTGTAWLEFPARSLLFTPYRGGRALPAISCQAAPGPVPASEVTVTTAPAVVAGATPSPPGLAAPTAPAAPDPAPAAPASTAPAYGCTSTYRTDTYRSPLPMTITASGARTVGSPLTITLSSPDTGLGAPAPGMATKLAFTGRLPVRGAQAGEVTLYDTTIEADSPTFAVSGRLRLTKAGMDAISFPRRFVYTVYLLGAPKAVFACTMITSPASAALTVRVAP